jgi:predicted transposase/invertase (TIGR01784 family)
MITTLFDPVVLEKGKEEGKKEGRKEGKLDDAKNMLMEGLGIPLIIKITELPEEEILKLKEELDKGKH